MTCVPGPAFIIIETRTFAPSNLLSATVPAQSPLQYLKRHRSKVRYSLRKSNEHGAHQKHIPFFIDQDRLFFAMTVALPVTPIRDCSLS